MITPTPEQQAIVAAAKIPTNNLMIKALAGCAKTSSLVMIAEALPPQAALGLVFNSRNKKELEDQFPSWFTLKTLNGLGHAAWSRTIGQRLNIDTSKPGRILRNMLSGQKLPKEAFSDILGMYRRAMAVGLVPSGQNFKGLVPDDDDSWREICVDADIEPNPEFMAYARELLSHSIRESFQGVCTFDDQIYMPALFGGNFQRFPLVMLDEAQDTSPINHIMVRKASSGRLIVVGDPLQSIYAWRGAYAQSMASLRTLRPTWVDLTLSTTFRCPRRVVERQLSHAPGFTAAPSAPEGLALRWRGPWSLRRLPAGLALCELDPKTQAPALTLPIVAPLAVLCRNNAPLLRLAFKLLADHVPCQVLGRELGKNLQTLAKKICPDVLAPLADFFALLDNWQSLELANAEIKGTSGDSITDKAECFRAIASPAHRSLAELLGSLESIFDSESPMITLATGHKAKGLEWHTVVHLDPWRVRKEDDQQEANLNYVIETRTKHTLVLVEMGEYVGVKGV